MTKKKRKYLMRRSSDARKRQKRFQQNPSYYDKRVELGSAMDPYEMTSTEVNPFTGATKRTFSSLRLENIKRKNPRSSTIYAHGTPPAQEASKLTENHWGYVTEKYRAIDDDTPSKQSRARNKKYLAKRKVIRKKGTQHLSTSKTLTDKEKVAKYKKKQKK
jgi:hypothetical protein